MTIERVVARYDLPVRTPSQAAGFVRFAEDRLGRPLPDGVRRYAASPGLATELARAYTAEVVFPDQVESASAGLGPGLRDVDLWLMTENQGVCVWAVPLDAGDDPPVLVAGDLRAAESVEVYARSLDEFTDAWAWDRACLERLPVVQAQSAPLDAETERYLCARFSAAVTTWAWPTRRALRFESDDGLTLTVWDDAEQCDWWISSPDPELTGRHVAALMPFSDLATSFWSADDDGDALLTELRRR